MKQNLVLTVAISDCRLQPRSGRRVVLFLTLEAIVGCVLRGTFKVPFSVWNNACVYGWCCFVSAKNCRTKQICFKSFLLFLPISLFQQTWHCRDSTDASSAKKQPSFCLFIGEICVAHLPVTQISRLFLKSRCDSCEMGDISVQIRPQRVSTCRHKCWLKQFSHLHCSSELFYTFLDWGARGSANVRAEVRSQYRKSTTGCLPSCSLTWAGWTVSSNVTSQNTEPSQTVMWLFKADYFLLFTACEKGKLCSVCEPDSPEIVRNVCMEMG